MLQPTCVCFVDSNVAELSSSTDVIPMTVGDDYLHRQARESGHFLFDARHAEAGVDQRRSPLAQQKVAVGVLPMPILTQGPCRVIDPLYTEPCAHPLTISPARGSKGALACSERVSEKDILGTPPCLMMYERFGSVPVDRSHAWSNRRRIVS